MSRRDLRLFVQARGGQPRCIGGGCFHGPNGWVFATDRQDREHATAWRWWIVDCDSADTGREAIEDHVKYGAQAASYNRADGSRCVYQIVAGGENG